MPLTLLQMTWFELPACMSLHVINACEEADGIVKVRNPPGPLWARLIQTLAQELSDRPEGYGLTETDT